MNFVSAYLIMQKADSDDPLHPPQEEYPKGWFKELLYNHPMDFPEYMGIEWDLDYAREVSATVNYDYHRSPPEVDSFRWDIESIDDFTPQPGYWVAKDRGDYTSPGLRVTFPDTPYYYMKNGSASVGRWATLTRFDHNGDTITESSWILNCASATQVKNAQGGLPWTGSKSWAYAISCKIKVPIFENAEDGAAYSAAATAYYQNPTQANYEVVCHYIDLCDNPDGQINVRS